MVLRRGLLFCVALSIVAAAAADYPQGVPLKRGDQPPVILLNGYQLGCSPGAVPSADTFGQMEALLAASGREVRFFDNCLLGRIPIEDLAASFGVYLAGLRYEDGGEVAQVDLVAHSMGGIIARTYLAGKRADGTYAPPIPHRVRKLVTIGTPHFGADLQGLAAPDVQAAAISGGTRLLFDLATWNQGGDDWRGVDLLAVAGRSRSTRTTDGLVPALQAAGYFAAGVEPDRTRVVPGCHTTGFVGLLLGCAAGEPGIANITGDTHPTWRLLVRFLNNEETWRDLYSASGDSELSTHSGLWLAYEDPSGARATNASAIAYYGEAPLTQLPGSGVLSLARVPQNEDAELSVSWNGQPPTKLHTSLGRGTRAMRVKDGVSIASVAMASDADGVYSGRARLLLGAGTLRIRGSGFGLQPLVTLDGAPLEPTLVEDDGSILVAIPPREKPGMGVVAVRADGSVDQVRVMFGGIPAKLLRDAALPLGWEATPGAQAYVLSVGLEPGKGDLFESWFADARNEIELPGLPVGEVFVRLWTLLDNEWYFRDAVIYIP